MEGKNGSKANLILAIIIAVILSAVAIWAYGVYESRAEKAEMERIVTIDPFAATGRVTYLSTGQPAEGATVTAVVNGNISSEAITAGNGYYKIDLPPYNSSEPYVVVLAAQKENYLSVGPVTTEITMNKRGAEITLYNDGGRLTENDFILVPESSADKEDILQTLRDYNIRIINSSSETAVANTAIAEVPEIQ